MPWRSSSSRAVLFLLQSTDNHFLLLRKDKLFVCFGEGSEGSFGECAEEERTDPDAAEFQNSESCSLGDDPHLVFFPLFEADSGTPDSADRTQN